MDPWNVLKTQITPGVTFLMTCRAMIHLSKRNIIFQLSRIYDEGLYFKLLLRFTFFFNFFFRILSIFNTHTQGERGEGFKKKNLQWCISKRVLLRFTLVVLMCKNLINVWDQGNGEKARRTCSLVDVNGSTGRKM